MKKEIQINNGAKRISENEKSIYIEKKHGNLSFFFLTSLPSGRYLIKVTLLFIYKLLIFINN